jgi:hypothetical protein
VLLIINLAYLFWDKNGMKNYAAEFELPLQEIWNKREGERKREQIEVRKSLLHSSNLDNGKVETVLII